MIKKQESFRWLTTLAGDSDYDKEKYLRLLQDHRDSLYDPKVEKIKRKREAQMAFLLYKIGFAVFEALEFRIVQQFLRDNRILRELLPDWENRLGLANLSEREFTPREREIVENASLVQGLVSKRLPMASWGRDRPRKQSQFGELDPSVMRRIHPMSFHTIGRMET